MANWNETINIAGVNRLYQTGGINLMGLAKGVLAKLKNTEAFATCEPELLDVMSAFEAIDELAGLKDYNVALDMLLEFADKDNRLWIEQEGVNPSEYDDVPRNQRNPFEEDTKPQFTKPHYHGNTIINKGPYHAQNGSEWVKHSWGSQPIQGPSEPKPVKTGYNGHVDTCTCDLCKKAKQEADDALPMWDSTKIYEVGEIVRYKNQKFECRLKHSNVDPNEHSHNKPDDSWKWLAMITPKPFDPELQYKDRLACVVKGKNYPVGRKHVHMSEDEFNRRLRAANIDPPTVPKDLYTYWKDCDIPYQDWIIARWHGGQLTYRDAN